MYNLSSIHIRRHLRLQNGKAFCFQKLQKKNFVF